LCRRKSIPGQKGKPQQREPGLELLALNKSTVSTRRRTSKRYTDRGPRQICDWSDTVTGHATLKKIERYTRDAERKVLALSTTEKVKRAAANLALGCQ
jgi:hypothetical protein